jgi:hypothetical protein
MINDLDTTLERIVYNVGNIPRTEVDISFEQPNREWSTRLSRPTLNLWAFDLRENLKLRPNPMQVQPKDARTATVYNPPLRIDISYWVSAWARRVEDEHNLLWRGLAALKKTPTIRPNDAQGELRYANLDIPLKVALPGEGAINISDLWGVLDNSMKLGFLVVATVELDMEMAVDTPLVLEQTLRVGQKASRAEQRLATIDVEFTKKGDPATQSDDPKE